MSTEPKPAAAPEAVSDPRAQAIKAWHECKNDADRKAAVKQHPILAELYSLAASLK